MSIVLMAMSSIQINRLQKQLGFKAIAAGNISAQIVGATVGIWMAVGGRSLEPGRQLALRARQAEWLFSFSPPDGSRRRCSPSAPCANSSFGRIFFSLPMLLETRVRESPGLADRQEILRSAAGLFQSGFRKLDIEHHQLRHSAGDRHGDILYSRGFRTTGGV